MLNNIFGVDLDANAVEVTKLSLLLKCMEGETEASISSQLKLFHERVLPTLDNNIKDGNSLIDIDFYSAEIDFGEEKKIKPFNWKKAFPEVFKQGGFDCVIGNPPYGATFKKEELSYIQRIYPVINKFPDSYCAFMVKAKALLREKGIFGFIVPNTFCDLENCNNFRFWFLQELSPILFFQTGWAFKDAVVDTLVFIASNEKSKGSDVIKISVGNKTYERTIDDFLKNQLNKIDYRNNTASIDFLNQFKSYKPLSEYAIIKAGVKLYEKGKGIPAQNEKIVKEKPFTKRKEEIILECWRPIYSGLDVKRYAKLVPCEFVNYGPWLAAPRNEDLFSGTKLLMRRTDDKLQSTIDFKNAICVNSCHVIKLKEESNLPFSPLYLLGLLNSKLFQKIFELQNPQMVGKVFSEIKVIYVERLPIKEIGSKGFEKTKHDEIVKLVDQLLQLNEEKQQPTLQSKLDQLQNRIDYAEQRINEIVYELYGLTKDEIALVENA